MSSAMNLGHNPEAGVRIHSPLLQSIAHHESAMLFVQVKVSSADSLRIQARSPRVAGSNVASVHRVRVQHAARVEYPIGHRYSILLGKALLVHVSRWTACHQSEARSEQSCGSIGAPLYLVSVCRTCWLAAKAEQAGLPEHTAGQGQQNPTPAQ